MVADRWAIGTLLLSGLALAGCDEPEPPKGPFPVVVVVENAGDKPIHIQGPATAELSDDAGTVLRTVAFECELKQCGVCELSEECERAPDYVVELLPGASLEYQWDGLVRATVENGCGSDACFERVQAPKQPVKASIGFARFFDAELIDGVEEETLREPIATVSGPIEDDRGTLRLVLPDF